MNFIYLSLHETGWEKILFFIQKLMIKIFFYRMKLHGFSICVDKEILSMKVSMPIDLEFDRKESKGC
jgi:hypothetical protein